MAQDLSPRAYGAGPIIGATASVNSAIFSFYNSMNFFGRSANFAVAVPDSVGDFHRTGFDAPKYASRSGLLHSFVRFSVNLKGGPAMQPTEFSKWRQKMLLGVGLKTMAPTGQYDPTRLLRKQPLGL